MPVLIPAPHGDLDLLCAPSNAPSGAGIAFLADPILDPIHFGFTASLARYAEAAPRLPDAEILMGTGNLTELTDADSSRHRPRCLLGCAPNSPSAMCWSCRSARTRGAPSRSTIAARRLMYAARADTALAARLRRRAAASSRPKPFPRSPQEIEEDGGAVRDANFRIAVGGGRHPYLQPRRPSCARADALLAFSEARRRDTTARMPSISAPSCAKAEIACALGKRYAQDEPLDWGCAAPRSERDLSRLAEAGHTLRAKRGGGATDDP